jgi:hypothetical protein
LHGMLPPLKKGGRGDFKKAAPLNLKLDSPLW